MVDARRRAAAMLEDARERARALIVEAQSVVDGVVGPTTSGGLANATGRDGEQKLNDRLDS